MKRNYHGHSYFSPFMLWGDLATKTLEMKQISNRPPAVKEWFESKVGPAWRKAGLPE